MYNDTLPPFLVTPKMFGWILTNTREGEQHVDVSEIERDRTMRQKEGKLKDKLQDCLRR